MSDTPKIGHLITEPVGRDAVHVAIAPVTAGERLFAGDHIGFLASGEVGAGANDHIGIVDPFIIEPVRHGERFYIWLYPGSTTGLRHVYYHPAFKAIPPEAKS